MSIRGMLGAATIALVSSSSVNAQYATIVDLGPMQNGTSYAFGINEAGHVTGVDGCPWIGCGGQGVAIFWSPETGVIDLGALPGDERSLGWALNAQGQVVGWSFYAADVGEAVLWEAGSIQGLGFLREGHRGSSARGINDAGMIVGDSWGGPEYEAYLWQDGTMIGLGTLGGDDSSASAINERGQVVGRSKNSAGTRRAYLWEDGLMIELPTLAGGSSDAQDINEVGQIIGHSDGQPVIWQDGVISVLPWYEYGLVEPFAVNNHGQIVGIDGATVYYWSSPTAEAIWLDQLLPRDSPWEYLTAAFDINDAGQIVGTGHIGGESHGYLLTLPSPCPADLSDDYLVNVADLLLLLAAWGPCPAAAECPADLDGDDAVGVADLTALLLAWGDCG